jgi:hypothetical protein
MSLILQEIGIVVAMQQPNPNLVTAEFLQLSGIIPLDWQLAREPINNDQKYVSIFKLAKYSAIGINIRSYSPQASIQNATQYINHQLLADGAWQNYGTAPVRAALKLVYTLPGRELNLDIEAAGMQFADAEITPVIMFSGNFSYNLSNAASGDSLSAASQVLTNWQTDLSAYCELITDRFLSDRKVIELAAASQNGDGNLEMEIPYAPSLQPITTLS